MIRNRVDSYIIKQENGILWKFTYDEKIGILYKFLQGGLWSDYKVLTRDGTNRFSIVLFSDNNIYVFFQNREGNIKLMKNDGEDWIESIVIENKENSSFDIYLKSIVYKNQIHIFYNIYNKTTDTSKIIHQIFKEGEELSNLQIIDTIKSKFNKPFNIYSKDDKGIFILYQKFVYTNQIGYKFLTKENKSWSDFYIVDTSAYPYKDYSITIFQEKLLLLYIKGLEDKDNLIYSHGNEYEFQHSKIFESENIESCTSFTCYNQIWLLWIWDNGLYSNFSIDGGESFNDASNFQLISSKNTSKTTYISNSLKDKKYLYTNEIYVIDDEYLKYLIISDVYPYINYSKDIEENPSCIIYFMEKIYEKILFYERKLKKKNQFIAQMKHIEREQELKLLSYNKKFEEVEKSYTTFKEQKELLNENITFMQNSLINKDKRINELEKDNIEKQNEIIYLQQEIKKFKDQLEELSSQINLTNTEGTTSFLKKMFNK